MRGLFTPSLIMAAMRGAVATMARLASVQPHRSRTRRFISREHEDRSKYMPHQGKQEMARRKAQGHYRWRGHQWDALNWRMSPKGWNS